jgi:hypothetical protein
MRNKQSSVREYHFPDSRLVILADDMLQTALRDLVQFETRGINAAWIAHVQTMSVAFVNIPSDIELTGRVGIAAEAKENAAEAVRGHIRSIRTMAINCLGTGSARYRAFGFDGMNEMRDEVLYFLCKRVLREGAAQMDKLAAEGLTAARLNVIAQALGHFEQTITGKQDAEKARDIQTEDRIVAGNALYREIVRICNTGKDLFAVTDEARYNDYIIYDTPSGKKAAKDETAAAPDNAAAAAEGIEPV